MHHIHNTIAAATYADIAALMGAAAALLTAIPVIVVWVGARIGRKRTDEIIAATTGAIQRFIASQMDALIANRDPRTYYTLELLFPCGRTLRTAMIPGVCVTSLENIGITITSHNERETIGTLVCKGFGHIKPHAHVHHHESVQVISGTMTCLETGRIFRERETWEIPPGEFHSATFQDCVLILRYHPPLFTAADRPVDLSAMAAIFPLI